MKPQRRHYANGTLSPPPHPYIALQCHRHLFFLSAHLALSAMMVSLGGCLRVFLCWFTAEAQEQRAAYSTASRYLCQCKRGLWRGVAYIVSCLIDVIQMDDKCLSMPFLHFFLLRYLKTGWLMIGRWWIEDLESFPLVCCMYSVSARKICCVTIRIRYPDEIH